MDGVSEGREDGFRLKDGDALGIMDGLADTVGFKDGIEDDKPVGPAVGC